MTRDVLIRISGLQVMEGDDGADDVEMITIGDYFQKNGKHYIIYDEVMEGFEGNIRNTVRVTPDTMDIRKKGVANAHMVFEQDKKNMTRYATPMGDMMIEVSTNCVQVEEQEDSLKIQVGYSLGINYQRVSECNITMDVRSKGKADFRLQS